MAAKKKLEVVQKEDVTHEVLASAIVDIAKAANEMKRSRLTERAILVLLKDKTGVPMEVIKTVLNGAADLDSYLKKG